MKDAKSIYNAFRADELRLLVELKQDGSNVRRWSKVKLTNQVSHIYGDRSVLHSAPKSPKPLKKLLLDHIKRWNIDAVNVAYAQIYFRDSLSEWENENLFNETWTVEADDGRQRIIHRWYAQPLQMHDTYIQPVIDPHHLFTNNRVRCCTKGMTGMGISPYAWWDVPNECKENGTGLSLEIAKELRDKQRNSFAQTTFSDQVESEMMKMYVNEAEWCSIIRHFYMAVDDAGVSPTLRLKWLLDMREKLLSYLKPGYYPPPGKYVGGLPIVQYEGFLGNVDRRIQLYAMLSQRSFNQRTISSLDSENIFGAFQVIIDHSYERIENIKPIVQTQPFTNRNQ